MLTMLQCVVQNQMSSKIEKTSVTFFGAQIFFFSLTFFANRLNNAINATRTRNALVSFSLSFSFSLDFSFSLVLWLACTLQTQKNYSAIGFSRNTKCISLAHATASIQYNNQMHLHNCQHEKTTDFLWSRYCYAQFGVVEHRFSIWRAATSSVQQLHRVGRRLGLGRRRVGALVVVVHAGQQRKPVGGRFVGARRLDQHRRRALLARRADLRRQ